jgi:hypothetical protein
MAASHQMILGGIWVYWCWLNIGVAIYDLVVRCGLGGGGGCQVISGGIPMYMQGHSTAHPQKHPPRCPLIPFFDIKI